MDLVEIPGDNGFARHPWETVRARFFGDVLGPVLNGRSVTLLDAGAGDGWFARQLVAGHPNLTVTCFDPGYADDVRERLPQIGRVSYSATQPDGSFDVLVLLDVLEHVQSDVEFLGGLSENVRPGGHVLISVPAWPKLFSRHDVALRHHRRYGPRDFRALLDRAGIKVIRGGGLFHSLLAPRALAVAAERMRFGPADRIPEAQPELLWRRGEKSRRVVEALLDADTHLSRMAANRGVGLPGLSCWALCRRP